ncbi:MAG: CRTAC1 family protein [Planctomycetaceae bacterium]|nr:CRTAC1 family protein [Planctomycetaceae bacterium]
MDNQYDNEDLDIERDDAVIGVAIWYSAIGLGAVAVVALGIGVYLWLQQKPVVDAPIAEVDLPTVRAPLEKPLPKIPFEDITEKSGIQFVHENGADVEKLLPETMGGGCAFFDYDSDGDQDIFLVNSKSWSWNGKSPASTMALYENDGTGVFTDVTTKAGLEVSFYGQGCAVGDFDNDGDADLYVTAVSENLSSIQKETQPGANHLYRNDGGVFVDMTQEAGIGGRSGDWGTSCGWFDFDRDGDLDLWVCNYLEWSREFDVKQNFTLTGGGRAYGRPQVFGGAFCCLYRNDGNGSFTDVSESAGLHITNPVTGVATGKSLGLAFCDFDGDDWIDVVVTNDTVQNFLFHNKGDGTFEEIAALSGIAYDTNGAARGAMGIDVACTRNDPACRGVVIGNFANEMSAYYCSLPDSTQFVDEAVAAGIGPSTRLFLTFGILFLDADLDGWQDLFHANGHLEEEISKVQASQTYEQAPQLFWNAGLSSDTEFVPLTSKELGDEFAKPMVGRGASYADIDGDGDLDLLIAATGQRPRLLRNNLESGNNWLRVKLQGNGTTTTRDAIGATLELTLDDGTVLSRMVSPTRSYLSQVELPVTFGLGQQAAKSLSIHWPDGTVQEIESPKLQATLVVEQEK